jgi:GTP cyclohydrolase IA
MEIGEIDRREPPSDLTATAGRSNLAQQDDPERPSHLAERFAAKPEATAEWQQMRPRRIEPAQWRCFEMWMQEILQAMGMPPGTPGTERTAQRFLSALLDATEGYEGDPNLLTLFPTECRGGSDCKSSQVVEGPIVFHSLCEHHALPFSGRAYVGYIAHEHIIGISKLTRLVRLFSLRFTVQERVGQQIGETLQHLLSAHGVAVFLEGQHLCTQMRGVRESGSVTRTTFWRGEYAGNPELRSEFLGICDRS